MSDGKTQSTTPDNSGQPTTTQNNAGQQATSQDNTRQPETTSKNELTTPLLYCPKCKSLQEIDTSKGVTLKDEEKTVKIQNNETPVDVVFALFDEILKNYDNYAKKLPKEYKLTKEQTKTYRRMIKTVKLVGDNRAQTENLLKMIISKKLEVPLKCGHYVYVEPYKILDALISGYYAVGVLNYLESKRVKHERDDEKKAIAELVANTVFMMLYPLATSVDIKKSPKRKSPKKKKE